MRLAPESIARGLKGTDGLGPGGKTNELVVALAGNPNTGKSTVFNALTGLRQHTGNWPGKTVAVARGRYNHEGTSFVVVDLPGTYSLFTNSAEEEIARDFLLSGAPDATVVVADAGCLERNLNLALQIVEITPRTVVCVNLIDEARKRGTTIDVNALAMDLGVPVVATAARSGMGLKELRDTIAAVATGAIRPEPVPVPYSNTVSHASNRLLPHILRLGFEERGARWIAMSLLHSSGAARDSLLRLMAERSAVADGEGGFAT